MFSKELRADLAWSCAEKSVHQLIENHSMKPLASVRNSAPNSKHLLLAARSTCDPFVAVLKARCEAQILIYIHQHPPEAVAVFIFLGQVVFKLMRATQCIHRTLDSAGLHVRENIHCQNLLQVI